MYRNIKFNFGEITSLGTLSNKTLNDPILLENKINILKKNFAERIVIDELIDKQLITSEDNCIRNEAGTPMKVLAIKTVSDDIINLYSKRVEEIIPQIEVERINPIEF